MGKNSTHTHSPPQRKSATTLVANVLESFLGYLGLFVSFSSLGFATSTTEKCSPVGNARILNVPNPGISTKNED